METSLQLRMQHQPDALNHLLYAMNDENVKQRPDKDKWSILENIAHLGRYQDFFLQRIERILKEEDPLFDRYVADTDEGFIEWCKNDFDHLMQKFYQSRKGLNDFLFNLNEKQLMRTARHPIYGKRNINGWTELFLLHEAHHFFTILKLTSQIISPE
jgi:hypothetical protein